MTTKTITQTKAAFLCFFLGLIGIHRLVMGYKNWWLMPLTLGGFWIWSLYDFVRIMTGKMTMADGTKLK
ncbi:MAG: TM2 domain-containing protein [Bacteroidota bacterium]|nr:TM2 domain-containing protein [Bacteroidota bacterium]